jgi:hypothetical protein
MIESMNMFSGFMQSKGISHIVAGLVTRGRHIFFGATKQNHRYVKKTFFIM